jgi:hypothetical protein
MGLVSGHWPLNGQGATLHVRDPVPFSSHWSSAVNNKYFVAIGHQMLTNVGWPSG